jgi:hypothetical protein
MPLRGAKPAYLPVEQATKLVSIVNLKTAVAVHLKMRSAISAVCGVLARDPPQLSKWFQVSRSSCESKNGAASSGLEQQIIIRSGFLFSIETSSRWRECVSIN